jgi:hypothetical protein
VVYSVPEFAHQQFPAPVPGYRYRTKLPVFPDLPGHGIRMYQAYVLERDRR